jgi:hypothetical protein
MQRKNQFPLIVECHREYFVCAIFLIEKRQTKLESINRQSLLHSYVGVVSIQLETSLLTQHKNGNFFLPMNA